VTLEYVFSAVLALSCQNNPSCSWLDPGIQYQSRTPTQNPNWCVINRGSVRSPVMMEVRPPPRMFLGPGIEPCDVRARPNAPTS
jgi:hypothetical protein